jgi:ATP-dependent RNA helicase RhlE
MVEHLLRGRDVARALVFTRTKHGADRVARHLRTATIGADALHGGKPRLHASARWPRSATAA